jgi:hypothetical protein
MAGDIPLDEVSYTSHREEIKQRVRDDPEYEEYFKSNFPRIYYEWDFTPDDPEYEE